MSDKQKKACHWAGSVFVVGLLALLVAETDFRLLWRHLRQLPPSLLLLLVSLQVVTQLLITYQWHHLSGLVLGQSHFGKILHIFTRGSLVEAVTPGGIGTFEGTMVALLTLLGIGAEVGLTITLVFRFVTFWLVILGSALFVVLYEGHLKWKGADYIDQVTSDSHTS